MKKEAILSGVFLFLIFFIGIFKGFFFGNNMYLIYFLILSILLIIDGIFLYRFFKKIKTNNKESKVSSVRERNKKILIISMTIGFLVMVLILFLMVTFYN